MKLQYAIHDLGQLRRDLLAVVEAHRADAAVSDERAWRDAFMCLAKELLTDGGYTTDHLSMLLIVVDDLKITKEG